MTGGCGMEVAGSPVGVGPGATASPAELTFTKNIPPLVGALCFRGWDDYMQPHDSLDPFEQILIDFFIEV